MSRTENFQGHHYRLAHTSAGRMRCRNVVPYTHTTETTASHKSDLTRLAGEMVVEDSKKYLDPIEATDGIELLERCRSAVAKRFGRRGIIAKRKKGNPGKIVLPPLLTR